MLQNKFQSDTEVVGMQFWPYWFLQIVRTYRRNYSLKVHAQLEHGDVIVGWQKGGTTWEAWNVQQLTLLLGDAEPSQEEWRLFAKSDSFEAPQPVWLSALQAAGIMLIARETYGTARPQARACPMTRASYENMGWMGKKTYACISAVSAAHCRE